MTFTRKLKKLLRNRRLRRTARKIFVRLTEHNYWYDVDIYLYTLNEERVLGVAVSGIDLDRYYLHGTAILAHLAEKVLEGIDGKIWSYTPGWDVERLPDDILLHRYRASVT